MWMDLEAGHVSQNIMTVSRNIGMLAMAALSREK